MDVTSVLPHLQDPLSRVIFPFLLPPAPPGHLGCVFCPLSDQATASGNDACAFRIQDLTLHLENGKQHGNGAEGYNPVVPSPPLRRCLSGNWAGPEFISTSLTRPQVRPRLLPLSFPIPDTTASFFFLLSSPVILPARLLSLRLSSLYFSLSLSGSLPLGVALRPAPPAVWGSASLPLRPTPCPVPSNPGSSGLALHIPIGLSGAPRPRPPGPSRSLSSRKVWLCAAEGGGGPARPSSAPGRPDPGPGPRTSPYLIPAPSLRVLALPVAQLRSSRLPAPSVRLSRCPSEGPLHPGPKVRPWP